MTRLRVIFLMFFALLYVSETINAQSKSPTAPKINQAPSPTPTPQGNINQPINQPPTNPSPPSIEHYQKLVEHYQKFVELAHIEVEWVRTAYKWLASLLAAIITFGIALGAFLTRKSIAEFKELINQETQLHMERVKSDIAKQINTSQEMLKTMQSEVHNAKSDVQNFLSNANNILEVARNDFSDRLEKYIKQASVVFDEVERQTKQHIRDYVDIEMKKMSGNEPDI